MATIDYLKDAVQDVVAGQCSVDVKLKYMHESQRIHELASELIAEILTRKDF